MSQGSTVTAQRVVLRRQRKARRTAGVAKAMEGAAGGVTEPEVKGGAAGGAAEAEDGAADDLHSRDKGRRSGRCCGS